MTDPLRTRILENAPLILDGGLATELERKGCNLDHRLWSANVLVERPALIREVHLDYLTAGAECIVTAGYQASIPGFVKTGLSEARARELYRDTFRLALEARTLHVAGGTGQTAPLIAASIGPYGAYLADGSEYRGDYGIDRFELERFHRPRIAMTVDWIRRASTADAMIAFETIPSLSEALVLAGILETYGDVSAWMSFSCRDDTRTCEGQPVAACADALQPFHCIAALGVNCTAPAFVPSLVRHISAHTDKLVLAYPNAGEAFDPERRTWAGQPAAISLLDTARQSVAAGASLIGGCCRTTPEDIARLVRWRNGHRRD